jgi:hypothetical protein
MGEWIKKMWYIGQLLAIKNNESMSFAGKQMEMKTT